jgi:hypothetical protein
VGVAALDEAEGCRVKGGFKDRIQQAPKHLLCDPIPDHRNAEGTELGLFSVFGDEYPAQRQRFEGARFERAHQSLEVILEVCGEHLKADFVDPGSASIAFHGLEGVAHEVHVDSANQRVSFLKHHVSPVCSITTAAKRARTIEECCLA